jgi:hypothetical protein
LLTQLFPNLMFALGATPKDLICFVQGFPDPYRPKICYKSLQNIDSKYMIFQTKCRLVLANLSFLASHAFIVGTYFIGK